MRYASLSAHNKVGLDMYDLIIKNGKLVTPDRVYEADIAVKDGKYAAFLAPGTETEAKEVIY